MAIAIRFRNLTFVIALLTCSFFKECSAQGVDKRSLAVAQFDSPPIAFEELPHTPGSPRGLWTRNGVSSAYFYPGEAVFAIPSDKSSQGPEHPAFLRMQFVGASFSATPTARGPLSGRVNYYKGARPDWRVGVVRYSNVRYTSLYPKVDLLFHGTPQDLEYDFVVRPGGDALTIELNFDGAKDVQIDSAGDLTVETQSDSFRFRRPAMYLESGGEHIAVAGGFKKAGRTSVRFWVGSYDKTRTLVIDPVLAYSTFFAGTVNAIALDSAGDVYIAGQAASGLPLQSAYQSSPGNSAAAFVSKFDPTLTRLIFSTYFSGSGQDTAVAMGVDGTGNVYITGNSFSPDIPTTNGAFMTQCPGICNTPFVAKFDPNGELVYSTFTGGSNAAVRGLAVDKTGDAYLTGAIASDDLPVVNAFEPTFAGLVSTSTTNAFVQKLDPTGSQLLYSTYLGGGGERGTAIAVDSSGSAYVVGVSGGTLPTKNPLQLDMGTFFLTKFTPGGNSLAYSTLLGIGGSQSGQPNSVAVDAEGNAYIAGSVTSLQYPLTLDAFETSCPNSFGISPPGCSYSQAIVMKMNATGTALAYSTLLGDGGANAIAVDSSGNAYVTGGTPSNSFPLLSAVEITQPTSANGPGPGGGAFVTLLDASGVPTFSTLLSGMSDNETGLAVAFDGSQNIFVGGQTGSSDFPVVAPFQSVPGNGFLSEISPANEPAIAVSRLEPLVHVRNVSSVPLAISDISVSGANGATFTMSGTCGSSITLAPGSECFITVKQTSPPPPGAAILTIASNVAGSPQTFTIQPSTLPLAPPQWVYSPAMLHFTPQYIGTTSAPQSITITNLADQPLTVDSIQPTSPDFIIAQDGCTGTISAGNSCSFVVAYSPTGMNLPAQINISYSAPFITGTGDPATISDMIWVFGEPSATSIFASVQSLSFGSQYAGLPGTPRIVTLFNPTPSTVNLGSPSVSGPFSSSTTCTGVLAPGASCREAVNFRPTGNGFASGNLQLPFSGAGSPINVSLAGTGKILSDLAISPLVVEFGGAVIGEEGNSVLLTLTNSSSTTLSISSFVFSDPQFSQTNDCRGALSAGNSCTANLLFTPTASGPAFATLSIQHSGVGSPQVISLSGTGNTPLLFLPASLDFGMHPVGTSTTKSIEIANNVSQPISIQSITVNGSNFQIGAAPCLTAGQQLPSHQACLFPITFTPSAPGTETGSLTVIASDQPAPHVAPLSGIGGSAANVSLSASALYFGFHNVGENSAAQSVTLTNTGDATLNISGIAPSAGFSESNTCGATLAAGASCSISVTFAPTSAGALSGSVSISDDAANSPQTVALSGNGTDFGVQPVAGGTNTVSVSAGQTATYDLQISPAGGFTGVVSLTCAGAPAKSTCSLVPGRVIVAGTSVPFTVNLVTTASSRASSNGKLTFLRAAYWAFILPVGLLLVCGTRRRVDASRLCVLAFVLLSIALASSCGGASMTMNNNQGPSIIPGTQPGTYAITISASSGSTTRNSTVSLTVH